MLLPEVSDDVHCLLSNGAGDAVQWLLPDKLLSHTHTHTQEGGKDVFPICLYVSLLWAVFIRRWNLEFLGTSKDSEVRTPLLLPPTPSSSTHPCLEDGKGNTEAGKGHWKIWTPTFRSSLGVLPRIPRRPVLSPLCISTSILLRGTYHHEVYY